MATISVTPVEENHLEELCEMAAAIWAEHYTSILGPGQVAYMVEKFQSVPAVKEQLETQGYEYYFLCLNEKEAGYLAIQPNNPSRGKMFLSKLYIQRQYRGQGLARGAMDFLKGRCQREGIHEIWLTVNRNNLDSIAVYEKLGFVKTRGLVTDIGGGYVMDDYVMEASFFS